MSQVHSRNSDLAGIARLRFLHAYWASIRLGDSAIAGHLPITPPLFDAEPATERPPPPAPLPFVLGGFRLHHRCCEIVCYLPGVHPIGSRWWQDLGAWFVVRGVAQPMGPEPPQLRMPIQEVDASTILH